jgi:hypothetical protein
MRAEEGKGISRRYPFPATCVVSRDPVRPCSMASRWPPKAEASTCRRLQSLCRVPAPTLDACCPNQRTYCDACCNRAGRNTACRVPNGNETQTLHSGHLRGPHSAGKWRFAESESRKLDCPRVLALTQPTVQPIIQLYSGNLSLPHLIPGQPDRVLNRTDEMYARSPILPLRPSVRHANATYPRRKTCSTRIAPKPPTDGVSGAKTIKFRSPRGQAPSVRCSLPAS